MEAKWQPMVVVVTDGKRLECSCGAAAVFMTLRRPDPTSDTRLEVSLWCQPCYEQEHNEESEEE